MRVDSRLRFKRPQLSQKQVADAQIGYQVENLGFARSPLQNINRIDNFPLFFSHINTEYRRVAYQLGSTAFDLHPIDVLTDLLIHIITIVSKNDSIIEPRIIDTNTDFSYNMVSKRFEGARFGKITGNKKSIDTHSDLRTFLEFLSKKNQTTELYQSKRNIEDEKQLYDWEPYDFELMKSFQDTFEQCMKILRIDDEKISCSVDIETLQSELESFDINKDGMNTYMNNRFLALMYILKKVFIYDSDSLDNELDPICRIYFPFIEYDNFKKEQAGGAGDIEYESSKGILRSIESVNYDLFASIYIQKSIKMMWIMYLMKKKLQFSFENLALEQLFNATLFMVHSDRVGIYLLDQMCTSFSMYCYLKICARQELVPNLNAFALIIFAPYYVFFISK